MTRIITVNRMFGSGGREFGKRLAEKLGIAYYDNEIITEIARRSGLAEDYVRTIVDRKPIVYYPITIGRTFLGHTPQPTDFNTRIYNEQHEIIKELAEKSDCLIIGRCADYILRDKQPIRFFIHADLASRAARCREKAEEDEGLSDRQLLKKIEEIDRERSSYYKFFTGLKWDDPSHYDLYLNTTSLPVKTLAESAAELIRRL